MCTVQEAERVDHLTEEAIERYLLEPDRFEAPELERVYAHLKVCSRCRSVHDFLKDFYARLGESESVQHEGAEDHLNKKKPLPEPTILHPMRDIPEFALSPGTRITVLAAETSSHSSHRFSTKAALVSEKEKILMRIVHDRLENRYRMYLIAEDVERIRNTKVSIPALGIDLTTNEHGVADFALEPSREEPDWKNIQAVLVS